MTSTDLANLVLLATCLAAAATDLRDRRIPNAVTAPALALGIAIAWYAGTLPAALVGLASGLVPGFLLFRRGALGGGDAKLLGAIGALAGPQMVLGAWIGTFACALAVLFYLAARRRQLRQAFRWTTYTLLSGIHRKMKF